MIAVLEHVKQRTKNVLLASASEFHFRITSIYYILAASNPPPFIDYLARPWVDIVLCVWEGVASRLGRFGAFEVEAT
jgi:hypothetical protein